MSKSLGLQTLKVLLIPILGHSTPSWTSGEGVRSPAMHPTRITTMMVEILILVPSSWAICYSRFSLTITWLKDCYRGTFRRSTLFPHKVASGSQVFELTPAIEVSNMIRYDKLYSCCQLFDKHVETQKLSAKTTSKILQTLIPINLTLARNLINTNWFN